MGGSGTTTVAGTLNLSSANNKIVGNGGNVGRTLISNGTATLSGGGGLLISASGGANPGSLFLNNSTFNVTDGTGISNNNFGGSIGAFTNNATGIFNKSGAATTTSVTSAQ